MLEHWKLSFRWGLVFTRFSRCHIPSMFYRGQCSAVRHFPSFALFVAFFPQLMAGPIERAGDLLPQLACKRSLMWLNSQGGFRRFLTGMVKKVGISPIFLEVADSVYMNPDFYQSGLDLWFTLAMVYPHFNGFLGIHRHGNRIGMMLGIRLSENFDEVFRTQNFRDFLEKMAHHTGPLVPRLLLHSVSKKSNKYIAGFLTFLLIGLWHGADAGFCYGAQGWD